jgi:molybdate transport system substrate-binding protein
LTYRTNALVAQAQLPQLRIVPLPESLQVGATYGLTWRHGAPAAAQAFAGALLQPAAQAILRQRGFTAP